MKKTYIEPANTVVRINTERMIALSEVNSVSGVDNFGGIYDETSETSVTTCDARDAVTSRDAWDE